MQGDTRAMRDASAALLRATSLDDDGWDDLLSFIEERRVIPIVDSLAPVLRPLHEVQQWRERIREAQRGAA